MVNVKRNSGENTFRKELLTVFVPLLKGVYSKREEFAPLGSKFFPFGVDFFRMGVTMISVKECKQEVTTVYSFAKKKKKKKKKKKWQKSSQVYQGPLKIFIAHVQIVLHK